MRIFLIILVILSYLGGIVAAVGISKTRGSVPIDLILVLCLVAFCNVACALYLHKRAASSKIEWALFGAIGNIMLCYSFGYSGIKSDNQPLDITMRLHSDRLYRAVYNIRWNFYI